MIRRLVHVGLTVESLDRMLNFYTNALGLTIESRMPHPRGGTIVFLQGAEGELIEMIQYSNPRPHEGRDVRRTGLHHFGLLVDDIYTAVDRMKALSVEFDGVVKPNTANDLTVHFWDPEGNRVHLTQRGK